MPLFPVTFQSQEVRHFPLFQNESRGRPAALVTRAGDVTQEHQGHITVTLHTYLKPNSPVAPPEPSGNSQFLTGNEEKLPNILQ